MRRTAVIGLFACLALTGCSNTGSSTADAKPSPSKTVSKADRYLTVAHGISFNGDPGDDVLLTFPAKWCGALDAGHSVKWMFDSTGGGGLYPWGADWGTAQQDADTLVVAGVKAYCPRNLKAVADELRASGEY
ncbi:hypothetical protein EDD90_3288 [Streptomyces sp. Ag109_O5-1]|uniref:hypothetical protein n=1 Tax=Streptomyces sp. Ag109_O5-1 TaxID=1938851 RepID=UPI000F50AE0B|nr:hypothetical protein [Streptomyces sp. Ag109_O5-1]RPE40252.1 hypothetical protein EDD90_3288 [Streptomyces sp. Ag109_O5-1]